MKIARWNNAKDGKVSRAGQGCGILLLLVFLFTGLGMLYVTFPIFKILAARHWNATPCVITKSAVTRGSGGHGPTYGIDISYTYRVGGETYTGNRYNFVQAGASSGHSAKAAVVSRFPTGTETVCYVNPKDPRDAVIERGFTVDMWWALFSLPFLCIGLLPMAAYVLDWMNRRHHVHGRHLDPFAGQGRELEPDFTRKFTALSVFIFAVVFCAVLLIPILTGVVPSIQNHDYEWMGDILFILFFMGGLWMLGKTGVLILKAFNPSVRIFINPKDAQPGEAVEFRWVLRGNVEKISRLRIRIERKVETSTGNGKDRKTTKTVFFSTDVLDSTNQDEFFDGKATLQLPDNVMPSHDREQIRNVWKILVKGTMRGWPDITDEFPLTMPPSAQEAQA